MTEQETVKQTANLLRRIIRSIDKKLEYNFIEPTEEGRFSLRLSTRGRAGVVSLLTRDLRSALADDVRKNAIRQKIKSTRDHLLSNYVEDVMGKKVGGCSRKLRRVKRMPGHRSSTEGPASEDRQSHLTRTR